jgi:nucleoside-diphosphate-sugar epimerase
MTQEKRILVAGGAGFLGSHVCERLLAHGNSVFCVDNFQTGRPENIAHLLSQANFKLLKHDIVEPFDLRVGEIYNLACPPSHLEFEPLPQDDPVRRQPDITRAGTILNWRPKTKLTTGLRATIAYFREQLEDSRVARGRTIPFLEPVRELSLKLPQSFA